ncbi:pentapeptide repeat-containing protein [Lentzea sp. NPDC051838]|uniref:pentapeptide repeat-containing protein n=1 Tax=Lentzea sp. NPDC051838 TaxID=3154849 RepID=UPI00341E89DA
MSKKSEEALRYTVLSPRAIWSAAALIVVLGIAMAIWLLVAYGKGDTQQRNQLEAIKTAGTIVVGTGGAAALLLAARRQRSAEIALKQKDLDQEAVARTHALQERVALENQQDATERRVAELYSKAVEQLGSDKPPVQMGGLYALERLGQANADQRQTIVNVLCAYLRMFTDATRDLAADRVKTQEHRVRQTAQTILTAHLRPHGLGEAFWQDCDIDLSGAVLLELDLRDCEVRSAAFTSATFIGGAEFGGTTFVGDALFGSAAFTAAADFSGVTFTRAAVFESVVFTGDAVFTSATFAERVQFESAMFSAQARFDSATFGGVPFADLPPDVADQFRSLPLMVPYEDITESEKDSGRRLVPVGIGATTFEPVHLDFAADSHFTAFLGPESGKTNLLRTVVRGIEQRYPPEEALIILVDYRRTMLEFVKADHLLAYAVSAPQLKQMMIDVEASLRKRLPGTEVTQEQLRNRSWWTGPELFVVVDDYDLVHTPGANPLEPLREFLGQAKDVGLHLVVAGRTRGAGPEAGDPVVDRLRAISAPGLVGNGDPADGPLVGTVAPALLSPGRATMVTRRHGRRPIQIAWLDED